MTLFRLFIRCTSIETKSLSIESTEAGNNHSVKTASSVCNRKETLLQINIYRVSTTIPCRQTYSSYLHNLKNATYIYICSLLIFVLSLLCEWVCAWYHLGLRKQKNKNTLMTAIRHSYSYTHTHIQISIYIYTCDDGHLPQGAREWEKDWVNEVENNDEKFIFIIRLSLKSRQICIWNSKDIKEQTIGLSLMRMMKKPSKWSSYSHWIFYAISSVKQQSLVSL